MNKKLVLCLDQGGSSSRAIVFDGGGRCVGQQQQTVAEHRQGALVEQNPVELLQSLRRCVIAVVADLNPEQRARLDCCGLITQRSSLVAVNRETGEALSPVLSWQDTRGESLLPSDESDRQAIYQLTGLQPNAHFGASKMAWLLRHSEPVQRAAEQGLLLFAPLASYLLYHLSNQRQWRVDRGNGSRTLLMDLATGQWHQDLLALFNLQVAYLPELVASDFGFGELCLSGRELAPKEEGESDEAEKQLNQLSLPIKLLTGDQCAAAFGDGRLMDEQLNINIGTGAFLLSALAAPNARDGLLNSVLHWGQTSGPHYGLEATVNGAGAAMDVMAEQLGVPLDTAQLEALLEQSQELPLFINTVSGLGAPDWRSDIEAFFADDEGASNPLRLAAVMESVGFLIVRNVYAMQRVKTIAQIAVSGGLANSNQLCQRLSDLSGLTVSRSQQLEASARGAAYFLCDCPEGWAAGSACATFKPQANRTLEQRFQRWLRVLEDCLVAMPRS